MFGSLGAPELLLVLLVAVILFGGRKLPELGKSLGEGIRNFKRSMSREEPRPPAAPEDRPPAS